MRFKDHMYTPEFKTQYKLSLISTHYTKINKSNCKQIIYHRRPDYDLIYNYNNMFFYTSTGTSTNFTISDSNIFNNTSTSYITYVI